MIYITITQRLCSHGHNNIPQAEMTITLSDLSVVADIKRLLKHIKGVESVKVRKTKSELDLSLEEVKEGKVVNVDLDSNTILTHIRMSYLNLNVHTNDINYDRS